MRWPSGDSKTTEQKSPAAGDMCSATMSSSASMSGTASLKASAAAPTAPRRADSSASVPGGAPDSPVDTTQLYSGLLAKCLLYGPIEFKPRREAFLSLDATSALEPIVRRASLNVADWAA